MNVEAKVESKMLGWQDQIYDLLRQNQITQFAYVPDAGHRILIDRSLADPQVQTCGAIVMDVDMGKWRRARKDAGPAKPSGAPRLSRTGARGLTAIVGKPSDTRGDHQHGP